MRKITLIVILIWATPAAADPITSNVSGCGQVRETLTWTSSSPTGFRFMAFHSPWAGCAETIEGNTRGLHVESHDPYTVTVSDYLLPVCGRVQFDAHSYSPDGLDPFGLVSYVFNTGVDCEFVAQGPAGSGVGVDLVGVGDHLPNRGRNDLGIDSRAVVSSHVTPVPEAETLWMLLIGLCLLLVRKL
jgi:hypothetical protein